jgi:hypothetical protein
MCIRRRSEVSVEGLSMLEDPNVTSEAEERVGSVLCGKYRLDSVLAVGGMATVYAATHRNKVTGAATIMGALPTRQCGHGVPITDRELEVRRNFSFL